MKRRYRIVRELPWILGGRPGPGFTWEGGEPVILQPGDSIDLEDNELEAIHHHLEGVDDEGIRLLEEVREKRRNHRAQQVAVSDLHPRAVDWITRALDERLRADKHFRELCARIIARGGDPDATDLAAALEEGEVSEELRSYLAGRLKGIYQKPGRKAPPRTTDDDLFVRSLYDVLVDRLTTKARRERQRRPAIRTQAKREVAELLGLSVRTVERIVRPIPLTKDGKGLFD